MNVHTGATHQVLNQARAVTDWNAFSDDAVLQGVVTRSAPWAADKALALGAHAGNAETQELRGSPIGAPKCRAPTFPAKCSRLSPAAYAGNYLVGRSSSMRLQAASGAFPLVL